MASPMIMRDYVSRQYGGNWPQKVAKMPDSQVACIYYKMLDKAGKLEKDKQKQETAGGRQLCMFESGSLVYSSDILVKE